MATRVTNSRNVYHLWANEAQEEAYTGRRNVSFAGDTAYSYRAVIGRIVRNHSGQRAFLVSTRHWSVTTSKHQSFLRGSIPSGELVFHLSNVDYHSGHAAALEEYRVALANLSDKADRARSYRDSYLAQLQDKKEEADSYCRFFGIGDSFTDTTVESIVAAHVESIRLARIEQDKRQKLADQRQRREMARTRSAWLAGENVYLGHHPDTLLRVRGEMVETSRGAEVPLYAARRLFALYNAGRDLVGRRIGHYHVSEASSRQIVIGCHVLTRPIIQTFAAEQGWA